MVLKLPWAQKRKFWAFEKGIFQFFANFWVTKLKPFSGKVRQGLQDQLISFKVGHGKLFEKRFRSHLNIKNECSEHLERKSSRFFLRFLSDEVKTIFWGSKAKHQKLFKSKFGHRSLLRKWFWSLLELKSQYCGRLKVAFSSFLQVFDWRS